MYKISIMINLISVMSVVYEYAKQLLGGCGYLSIIIDVSSIYKNLII